MKIRLIRKRVGKRSQINVATGVFVQVRVRLHGEDERCTRITLRVKGIFVAML